MAHVNLLGNEKHFYRFCAEMDKQLECSARYCHKTCWAEALRFVQGQCNKGISIAEAVRKWSEKALSCEDEKEILAESIGVNDLDDLTAYLREEK